MNDQSSLTVWKKQELSPAIPSTTKPSEVLAFSQQLSTRDQRQVLAGFESGSYEMATNFVWIKAMAALKRELSTVGMKFLGEMLGRPYFNEDSDPVSSISDGEAIRLAEDLGVVSSTEAMRLRRSLELVVHFGGLDSHTAEQENVEMTGEEALLTLRTCIKNILGKERITVSKEFGDFRIALESQTLEESDTQIQSLVSSPYFFRKLAIDILCTVAKTGKGANLEHTLANLNTLLPLLWDDLRETERWQVGKAYAEVHTAGLSTATGGLRKALLKVKGFDFVPENLRSNTFIEAAEKVFRAHEAMNNFYNEEPPMMELNKLGTIIPTPALHTCVSAALVVRLGNGYGISYTARPHAEELLNRLTAERWEHYLNHGLPTDLRILGKIEYGKSANEFCSVASEYEFSKKNIKFVEIRRLIDAATSKDQDKVSKEAKRLRDLYYKGASK